MAKIDISSINGYQDMTPEEKVNALEAFEYTPEADVTEITKLKNALNKASSEVADYKKQIREKMSQDEQKEAEKKEKEDQLMAELNSLRKEKTIAGYVASYIGMGYSADLARSTAEALESGDINKVFENQKTFNEGLKQATKDRDLGQQPPLSNGKPLSSKAIQDEETEKLRRAMMGYI